MYKNLLKRLKIRPPKELVLLKCKYRHDSIEDNLIKCSGLQKRGYAQDVSSTGKSSSSSGGGTSSTMYKCRKYGHQLPSDSVTPNFDTLPNISTGIFRDTSGEILGRGANKGSYYQNPEYFSYHHMTFYDIHMLLRPCRQPSAKTGRKK